MPSELAAWARRELQKRFNAFGNFQLACWQQIRIVVRRNLNGFRAHGGGHQSFDGHVPNQTYLEPVQQAEEFSMVHGFKLTPNHHDPPFFQFMFIPHIDTYLATWQPCKLAKVIHAMVTSRLAYCNSLYASLPIDLIQKLQLLQNVFAHLLTGVSVWVRMSLCYTGCIGCWLNTKSGLRLSY